MAIKSKDKVIKRYPNGATLIYYRHNLNNTTRVAMGFKTGSRTDGEQFGKTHFLEHMLFHDCQNKSEIELSKLGNLYDSNQNAFTGYNFISTDFDCPNKNLLRVIKLNKSILKNRNFSEENFQKEREVVKEEMFKYNYESQDSLTQLLLYVLEDSPNLQISILGYEKELDNLTREDLIAHADDTFVSENLVISVCSSLPYEKIEEMMEKNVIYAFPSYPEAEVKDTLSIYNCNQSIYIAENESDCQTAQLSVFFKSKKSPQSGEKYSILDRYFLNGMHGKLHEYFRIKNQLSYDAVFKEVDLYSMLYKNISITTTPKKINMCIDALSQMLNHLKENGITKQEYDEFRIFLKNQKQRTQTVYGIADPMTFISNYLQCGDPFAYPSLKDYESITYEEANAYMKDLFADTYQIVLLSGKFAKRSVYGSRETLKKLGARTTAPKEKFDLTKIINMSYNDLCTYISTTELNDRDRYLSALVADYNREKEFKELKKVRSHPPICESYSIEDCEDYENVIQKPKQPSKDSYFEKI